MNHKTDPAALVDAARAAAGDHYLGDVHVLDRLAREAVARVLDRFDRVSDGRMDRSAAAIADQEECANLAGILCGNDPGYAPVPGWTGAGLAGYIRQRMGNVVQDGDDQEVVAQAAAVLVHQVYEIIGRMGSSLDRDVAAAEMAEACRSFAWMAAGVEGHD